MAISNGIVNDGQNTQLTIQRDCHDSSLFLKKLRFACFNKSLESRNDNQAIVILKALAEVSLKTAFVVLSFFDKKAKCLKTKYDKVIDLP